MLAGSNGDAAGVSVGTCAIAPGLEAMLVSAGAPPAADVVLLGDLCYERDLAARLMRFARAAAGAGGLVLLGDPGRAYRPGDGLRPLARHAVPTSRAIEDAEVKDTTVWRILASET